MNQKIETPTLEEGVCATLFLANAKTARNQFVYGVSGHKYVFKYSEAHKRLIRSYTSREQFQREELDIRRNVRNPFWICTWVGAVDVVSSAREAVDALIGEHTRVSGAVKTQALQEIASKIFGVIGANGLVISTERDSVTVEADPDVDVKVGFQAVDKLEKALDEMHEEQRSSTDPSFAESELMQKPIADLKLLAESLEVKQIWRLRTRPDLVHAIVEAQSKQPVAA